MVGQGDKKDSVTVAPEVFLVMAGHASSHPACAVHGVLVGSRTQPDGGRVDVVDAYPVCHETPTKTLVETAVSLVLSALEGDNNKKSVVGWYTAPELLGDKKAGPVALRVVASLASVGAGGEPVLLVVDNESIVQLSSSSEKEEVEEKVTASGAVQAYGKDFGMQWMEQLDTVVLEDGVATAGWKSLLASNVTVRDLVDHWEGGASSDWTSASALKKYLE
jgi:hypothetical protein